MSTMKDLVAKTHMSMEELELAAQKMARRLSPEDLQTKAADALARANMLGAAKNARARNEFYQQLKSLEYDENLFTDEAGNIAFGSHTGTAAKYGPLSLLASTNTTDIWSIKFNIGKELGLVAAHELIEFSYQVAPAVEFNGHMIDFSLFAHDYATAEEGAFWNEASRVFVYRVAPSYGRSFRMGITESSLGWNARG